MAVEPSIHVPVLQAIARCAYTRIAPGLLTAEYYG